VAEGFRRFPRARGPRRIRPELWVGPPPISFCQILFDRIGWASGAGAAAVAAALELGGRLRQQADRNSTARVGGEQWWKVKAWSVGFLMMIKIEPSPRFLWQRAVRVMWIYFCDQETSSHRKKWSQLKS